MTPSQLSEIRARAEKRETFSTFEQLHDYSKALEADRDALCDRVEELDRQLAQAVTLLTTLDAELFQLQHKHWMEAEITPERISAQRFVIAHGGKIYNVPAPAGDPLQPIDAPKQDGTEYLCWVPGLFMGFMVLSFYDGMWREKVNGMGLKIEPSKFWALPDAPAEAEHYGEFAP